MNNINKILTDIDFVGRLKSNGTGRGLMLIAGIIILIIYHPNEAKEYAELISMGILYGASNMLRKEKSSLTEEEGQNLPKEVIERLINISTLDRPAGIDWFLDPVTNKKYQKDKRTGEYAELSNKKS